MTYSHISIRFNR